MPDRLHLSARHRRILEALLREHLPDVEVWAYGSRVNGRSHDGKRSRPGPARAGTGADPHRPRGGLRGGAAGVHDPLPRRGQRLGMAAGVLPPRDREGLRRPPRAHAGSPCGCLPKLTQRDVIWLPASCLSVKPQTHPRSSIYCAPTRSVVRIERSLRWIRHPPPRRVGSLAKRFVVLRQVVDVVGEFFTKPVSHMGLPIQSAWDDEYPTMMWSRSFA